jgi:hypothetical protein
MTRQTNPALAAFGVLGTLGTAWMISAFTVMITVGVVHSWWPLVPTMPFTVALALGAVKVGAVAIGQFLGELLKVSR